MLSARNSLLLLLLLFLLLLFGPLQGNRKATCNVWCQSSGRLYCHIVQLFWLFSALVPIWFFALKLQLALPDGIWIWNQISYCQLGQVISLLWLLSPLLVSFIWLVWPKNLSRFRVDQSRTMAALGQYNWILPVFVLPPRDYLQLAQLK